MFLSQVIWPHVKDSCLTHGINGVPFPKYDKPLKWGGDDMFRRIRPFTNNREVLSDRPNYAYKSEESDG